MTTLALGRTLTRDRSPAEPEYVSDEGSAVNVFDRKGPHVAWPDGGFHLEAMDSHGALICSAPDLLKFARVYNVDGTRHVPGSGPGAHTGALSGTFTLLDWRGRDVQLAVLFNQRGSDADQAAIMKELGKVADGITDWP